MRRENDATIYTQEVCLNGHQITAYSKSNQDPNPANFCEDCGVKVICTCQSCQCPIDGKISYPGVISNKKVPVPSFCKYCGNPYPWTESIIEGTKELLDLDSTISSEDKESIENSVPDLLVDTPKTKVAATKFKMLTASATSIVKDGLRELLVDVVSETAKKIMFPN